MVERTDSYANPDQRVDEETWKKKGKLKGKGMVLQGRSYVRTVLVGKWAEPALADPNYRGERERDWWVLAHDAYLAQVLEYRRSKVTGNKLAK